MNIFSSFLRDLFVKYPVKILESAHKASIFNKSEILKGETCACFHCKGIFKTSEIEDWVDEDDPRGETPLCPYCDIDSVLGSEQGFPINDPVFLNEMKEFYF